MELSPSRHALAHMEARGVTWAEVVETCQRPHVVEPHQGRRRFVRDGLAVVVAEDGTVVTVLLRASAQWTDGDARARTANTGLGRDY
jgi:hypothetical protein